MALLKPTGRGFLGTRPQDMPDHPFGKAAIANRAKAEAKRLAAEATEREFQNNLRDLFRKEPAENESPMAYYFRMLKFRESKLFKKRILGY